MKILLIDNFDSFTYNLVDEFEKRGHDVVTYRNDVSMERICDVVREQEVQLIVISPGPGAPCDAGVCIDVIRKYSGKVPLFGICLGHQAIVEAFGGRVGVADETLHGKTSLVFHDGKALYEGIECPFACGRYHSLAALELPDCLSVVSKTESGVVMGVRHKKYMVEGVQFHPESILTPVGGKIVENMISVVKGGRL